MSADAPIFIIGTERSGSNLLRLILNQHPSIAIPHPPHIMKEMAPLEPLYGDLSSDRNFRRLVGDVVRLVELHFAPWDVALDAAAAFAEAPGRDVYGVKAAVYDQYRRAKGKRRWGCKSTFVIDYVDRVLRRHPRARFLHLVRDGRDVAVSARDSVFNHFHPFYVARLWERQQRAAADWSRRLSSGQFLTVRYEDLLADPAATVRRICAFLGEDYSESLLDYSRSEDARSLAAQNRSWQNCARPLLASNTSKFRTALPARDVRVFEREAFEQLQRFGYPLVNDPQLLRAERGRLPGPGARLAYWIYENVRGGVETVRSWMYDANAPSILRKRLFVRTLRLRRRL